MTPCPLADFIAGLDDRHGRGGKTRLARQLGWSYSTLWRKLNGKSPTTRVDVLAAEAVAARLARRSSGAA